MFAVKIKGMIWGVSFSFFAVTAMIFLCTDASSKNIFTALVGCALHECGHLVFMFLFDKPPEKVILYGGGIRITPSKNNMLSSTREMIVLLAGCGFNFIGAGIWFALKGLDFFCEVNLLLGIFNLLPFKYFDGGRVLEMLLVGSAAYDHIRAFFIFLGAVGIILMNLNGMVSISFMLTFCFVVFSEVIC